MATTSWRYPGRGSNATWSGAVTAWPSPGEVTAPGGQGATASQAGGATYDLKADQFGFGSELPPACSIDGIEIRLKGGEYTYYSGKVGRFSLLVGYSHESFDKIGTLAASGYLASLPGSGDWPLTTYGGTSDTIISGLTRADVVSESFGTAMWSEYTAGNNFLGAEYIQIRVHYTEITKQTDYTVKDGGVWKTVDPLGVKDGGVWKEPLKYSAKDGGIWKKVYGEEA